MVRIAQAETQELVAALQPNWLAWLRARHRALEGQHRDLVQQTAADLLQWVAARPETPGDEDVRRVGFRILQRRVADTFRSRVHEWADDSLRGAGDTSESPADPASEPPAALNYARLMRALLTILSALKPQDTELLLGEELSSDWNGSEPPTPAVRKRLSRLRERIRRTLRMEHGIDIDHR